MTDNRFSGNTQFIGTIDTQQATFVSGIPRSELRLESLRSYPIPFESWRKTGNVEQNLGQPAGAPDLGLTAGAFGTEGWRLDGANAAGGGAGTGEKARAVIQVPVEFVEPVAGSVGLSQASIRVWAGMVGAVADQSCTVAVGAYRLQKTGLIYAGNLISQAAQTMNSLTFAALDFALDTTNLLKGDELDIEINVVANDTSTPGPVTPRIGSVEFRCNVRG